MQIAIKLTKENVTHRKPGNTCQYHIARALKRSEKPVLTLLSTLLLYLLVPAAVVFAQDKHATSSPLDNPLVATNKRFYAGMKNILLSSAQKVPEEYYSFKPTEAVRSYGQIIGHIAQSQYGFCSIVLGEKNPAPKIEQTKTSKADLIAALKDAFSYCDKAYNGMTDVSAPQMVKFMGKDTTKLGVLTAHLGHNALHYGNLVTYMRLKNIVPPTSDPGFLEPPKK